MEWKQKNDAVKNQGFEKMALESIVASQEHQVKITKLQYESEELRMQLVYSEKKNKQLKREKNDTADLLEQIATYLRGYLESRLTCIQESGRIQRAN